MNSQQENDLPLGNDPDFGDDAPEEGHEDADESMSNEIIERYKKDE